jgi:hypothetical protein
MHRMRQMRGCLSNKNAKAAFFGIKMPIAVISLSAVALISALYIGGMNWASALQNEPIVSARAIRDGRPLYRRRLYGYGNRIQRRDRASGNGQNGSITAVTVTSYRDDSQYFTRASSQITAGDRHAICRCGCRFGRDFQQRRHYRSGEEALSQAK